MKKILGLILFLVICTRGWAQEESAKALVNAKFLFDIKGDAAQRITFNQPAGIDVDGQGNIFLADTVNSRVVVLDDTGKVNFMFGKLGAGEGDLNAPMALSVDSSKGLLYVADSSNNRVQVFKTDGAFVKTIDLNQDASKKNPRPIGIAVNKEGNIYVADADNNLVRVFSAQGKPLFKFGGFGAGDGQLCVPVGIDVDEQNKVYVVDMNNSRVQIFDSDGKFLLKMGSAGDAKGNFGRPKDVVVDKKGNIFVSDGASLVVQIFDKQGAFLNVIGAEKEEILQFAAPFGLAINNNYLYVTDRWRNSIRVFDISY